MQPSYPLPIEEKLRLRSVALKRLREFLTSPRTKAVIISHYHYDHHPHVLDPELPIELFRGKLIVAKNPNKFINRSQWGRVREFFEGLAGVIGLSRDNIYIESEKTKIDFPEDQITIALSKSFGDYDARRRELLDKGRRWFRKLADHWTRNEWVKEFNAGGTRVMWGDDRRVEVCGASIRFTPPWFHGVEYDRTGWVIGFTVNVGGRRIFFSSDVMGPIIEDYAEYIIDQKPDIVVLDGPPTYLFPYTLNRINLDRAVENALRILESSPDIIIYDHHLLREKRWRRRVSKVFEAAEKVDVKVMTAAEFVGMPPLIDTI